MHTLGVKGKDHFGEEFCPTEEMSLHSYSVLHKNRCYLGNGSAGTHMKVLYVCVQGPGKV